jgi:hypothetical protein
METNRTGSRKHNKQAAIKTDSCVITIGMRFFLVFSNIATTYNNNRSLSPLSRPKSKYEPKREAVSNRIDYR